jgi:squid-like protein
MADIQDYEMSNGEEQSNDQVNGSDLKTALKDEERKLFVGGLSWETTEKELREYFSKFGDIESVNIKTDSNTGRSRGFSFIVFKNADSLDKVFEISDHVINNKKVDPKKAKLRPGKIFVGGLTPEMTDDDIKSHFAQFGTITLTEMPFDKVKNQRKGFCFITFESDQMINEIVKNPKQMIKGKMVDVKKATPKPGEAFLLGAARSRGRGRGIRGGGRGYPVPPGYPMPDYSAYGYGYDYYGYGAGYGYDYYASDPYGYGYDYSGYGYDAAGYPPVAPPPPPPPPAIASARGRGKAGTGKQGRGSRGYRHTPY